MKTFVIKNLSTMRDDIVLAIVPDLIVDGLREYAERALKHFCLKCDVKEDEVNGRVTYTFTDKESGK